MDYYQLKLVHYYIMATHQGTFKISVVLKLLWSWRMTRNHGNFILCNRTILL